MLTVLFDLDDTLLSNEIDTFQKHYFHALGQALIPWVDPEKMMRAMKSGIAAMLTKSTPSGTMEETFDAAFYPAIGVIKELLAETIDSFYKNSFPELRQFTRPRPAAQELVRKCFQHGWNIIIATNPLFPSTAIHQRLAWAGLSRDDFPYSYVTVFEKMHFCKPHPAYYAEVLSLLCWPKGPVAVVGNNLVDDILPMEQLGHPAFWLTDAQVSRPDSHPLSSSGQLEDVFKWLENLDRHQKQTSYNTPLSIMATLQATPAAVQQFAAKLKPELWNLRPQVDEWSFTELICHWRDVDREVNLPRFKEILASSNPFLPGINTDVWTEERDYINEHGPDALTSWIETRTLIIQILSQISNQDWGRSVRHAIFGPTTLLELVSFSATHDRVHIQQAWDTISRVKSSH